MEENVGGEMIYQKGKGKPGMEFGKRELTGLHVRCCRRLQGCRPLGVVC